MKSLFITFSIFFSFNIHAEIICHTPRMNKIFEVSDKKITFFKEFDSHAKREIASSSSRTLLSETGVTKYVEFENQKHTIHLGSMNQFSDLNDYIIIKAKNGHEVIYPLTCELK